MGAGRRKEVVQQLWAVRFTLYAVGSRDLQRKVTGRARSVTPGAAFGDSLQASGGCMQDFTKLAVWEKSHELVLEVYRVTARLPERGYPGLISQLRRAAASIPANIVEGCGHSSQAEFARFLQLAGASGLEVAYHLLLARDLGALTNVQYARLEARTIQVRQMLGGLLRRVRSDLAADKPTPRVRVPPGVKPTAENVQRNA